MEASFVLVCVEEGVSGYTVVVDITGFRDEARIGA